MEHTTESDVIAESDDGRAREISDRISSQPESGTRHKNELFSACFADAALGLSITDLQGRFLAVNPAFCAITGYSEAELRAVDVQAITHPDDRSKTMSNVRALISGDLPAFVIQKRYVRKDGIVLWIESSVSLTRDHDGRPLNLVRISQDITARKRLEEELRKAREFSEQLIQTAHAIILGLDLQGNVRMLNRAAEEITGYSQSELKGRNWFDTVVPRDRYPDVRNDFNKFIAVKAEHRLETPILTKTGDERFVRWHSNPVVIKDKIVATVLFGNDVTEQKQAHDALRTAEEKYRHIFENAGEGIFQTTPEGRYLSANPALARIHGFDSPDELIQSRTDITREIYVDPNYREEFKRLLAAHGIVRGFEHQRFRKDGTKIWVSLNARAVRDESNAIVYYEGTVQDIDERKQAEAELLKTQEHIESVLASVTDTHTLFDREWRYLYVNQPAVRAIGRPREQIIGHTLWELYPDIIGTELDRQYHRAMDDRIPVTFDFHYLTDDTWWENRFHPAPEGLAVFATDITDRKQAEAARRESEERYRDLVENSRELICTHDLNGLILSANRAAVEALGYDSNELEGKNIRDILASEVRHEFDQYVASLREHGATRGIMQVQTRTGERRIWEYYNSLRTEGLASPIVRGMALDITERRRAEAARRESEERYRELFENAKDAMYVHDLSGRYISVNRAAEELSGYTRDEIIGKHFSNFMAPRHLKDARTNLVRKLDKMPVTNYEVDVITKNRRRVPVEVSSRLIYEHGVPLGVQGIARDITERKRAEEALARLALIVESSDDAIVGKTLDGTILSWNSGAAKIYGYSAREVIGLPVSILVPPDCLDEVPQILEQLRRGESIKHYETTRRKKDGTLFDVSLTISPIKDSGGKVVGASTIARDITKSKQTENALKEFSRRLIAVQEAERHSIARELHDEIGQVLTAVRINLQSIQRSGGANQNGARLDESISIVDEALGRVRELSLDLRPALLDDLGLSTALQWYVDRYAQRTGIIAEVLNGFEDEGRLPRPLETACFRIAQEALTNVARHAQAGNVSVRLERSREMMRLTVMDDGVGFDINDLRTNALAASTLGLRGMEERALAVGGQVEIDSGVGRGTRVCASFPLGAKVT